MVEHPERMCNHDVNDPISEHENDIGTDPKSIQFAFPEQMPPSNEQSKHCRGTPCKPKSPDTGDKPKRGRGDHVNQHLVKLVKNLSVIEEEGHRSVKILHLNQRNPRCITRSTTQSQITFTN